MATRTVGDELVIQLTEDLGELLQAIEEHPSWTSQRIREEAVKYGVLIGPS